MTKTCKACGTENAEFYKGVTGRCKECHKAGVRKNRQNDDHYREYDRMRSSLPHRKESRAKTMREWRKKNPQAYIAQTAVSNALRDGRIKKSPCVLCDARDHVHAHHRDYSRPLDVVWVCAKCHHRLHAIFPELEGRNKQVAP